MLRKSQALKTALKYSQTLLNLNRYQLLSNLYFLEQLKFENKKIFVAGTGQPDHIVNIYIDDKFVGSAKVDTQGTFLMESSSTLSFGNHTVRADMLGNGNAIVVARAQVPLIHDLQEAPKELVVANAADANNDSKKEEPKELVVAKSADANNDSKKEAPKELVVAKVADANNDSKKNRSAHR